MSFNKHDIDRDACQLFGSQAQHGYDWWWHSFTGHDEKTGEERSFFIEFFLCNPALGKKAPVLGQLPTHPVPSYLMVKAGWWGKEHAQLHRFFGWREINVSMDVPFKIEAADCLASETALKGSVVVTEAEKHPEWMCDNGSMRWDLQVDKKTAFNVGYGAGGLFRKLQLFEMFWHAEGMKTEYRGVVQCGTRRFVVDPESCYGYADKNWGKNFTSPWVWISSNDLVSEISGKRLQDSVFDIGGGKPKVGPLELKGKLLSAFWYEGKPYEFNFSKFWTFTRTRFECHETDTEIVWHVEQRTWRNRMVTDLRCQKEEMLLVNYEDPSGAKRHNRLFNGGNGKGTVELWRDGRLADRIRVGHAGCEYGEFD